MAEKSILALGKTKLISIFVAKYISMFNGINAIEFAKKFKSNEDCYCYLIELKWGKGYKCKKCGCQDSMAGNSWLDRKCRKCNYTESVTANTLFHGHKASILKLFYMTFRIACKKKGISTVELGTEVGVRQKSAWLFKRKVQVAMSQDFENKLQGEVDVDETLLGYHTDRAHCGRNLEEREAVMVAVEKLEENKTGNIRLMKIDSFTATELKEGMETMIDSKADITTDDFKSYQSLKKDGMDLEIVPSTEYENHVQVNRQIMNFKHWLTGIHHKWTKEHLQAYADEHVFRFNNRNNRKRIFNTLINRMITCLPHPYSDLARISSQSA